MSSFRSVRITLLDAVSSADDNSGWLDISDLEDVSVHVFGIVAGDEVTIFGSNEEGTPANGIDILDGAITEDGIESLTEFAGQIQAELTAAAGGGDVTAILTGRKPVQ